MRRTVLLRDLRVRLLESEGFRVESVETDDEAMNLLQTAQFDLVLLGHQSALPEKIIDQRIRERFPNLATLKIEIGGERYSAIQQESLTPHPKKLLKLSMKCLVRVPS